MKRRAFVVVGLALAAFGLALNADQAAIGRALSTPLEQRFDAQPLNQDADLAGIIVLAGDFERFRAGVRLASEHPDWRLVLITGPHFRRAYVLAVQSGVAPERIILELASKNTYENAVFTARTLRRRSQEKLGRWALVTSGVHMPRAMGVFRKAGFDVAPYPVLSTEYPQDRHDLWLALHEWIGLLGYYMLGRTDELFPAARSPQ